MCEKFTEIILSNFKVVEMAKVLLLDQAFNIKHFYALNFRFI